MCHNSVVGHGGSERTVAKLISLDHNWPNMRQHVKLFIRQYPCCQKMDNFRIPIKDHHYVTSSYTPFEVLNIDYVGPYPDDGYVLVIIYTFTRWVGLYWCQDASASWASDCLLQHFGRFGSPSLIRSDRGSHFANDRTGTPHNLTLAYSKQEMPSSRESTERSIAISAHSSSTLSTSPATARRYPLFSTF
jgi:Integrase zinc binding domain